MHICDTDYTYLLNELVANASKHCVMDAISNVFLGLFWPTRDRRYTTSNRLLPTSFFFTNELCRTIDMHVTSELKFGKFAFWAIEGLDYSTYHLQLELCAPRIRLSTKANGDLSTHLEASRVDCPASPFKMLVRNDVCR